MSPSALIITVIGRVVCQQGKIRIQDRKKAWSRGKYRKSKTLGKAENKRRKCVDKTTHNWPHFYFYIIGGQWYCTCISRNLRRILSQNSTSNHVVHSPMLCSAKLIADKSNWSTNILTINKYYKAMKMKFDKIVSMMCKLQNLLKSRRIETELI